MSSQPTLLEAPPRPLPAWLPPRWRAAVAGRAVELVIPEGVRRRCRKPRRIAPSEWSAAHRRMPSADAHPGAYRPEFSRYAAQVMDTWAQPWVREVWFCGVDQAGKTNTMLSCIGWSIEHAPGNVFYQMPDEASSDKIMGKKLIPMLRESPRLARLLSPRADDTGLAGVTLATGVGIIPSWSGSLTSTAAFSAKYTFSDEIDKMRVVGKEADPVDRIRKRTRTNRFGKHFFTSTPAGAWIYKGTRACVQVWEAAARCPECGELVVMDLAHLVYPEEATAESVKADPGCVEYACNACGVLWDEAARARAYHRGGWVCVKGADVARPAHVGFVLSAFPLPDVPLAQIAQVALRAKAGDLSAERDLAHGIQAVDWEAANKAAAPEAAAILELRNDLPALTCPPGTVAVTCGLDMQKHGFWATLWAFPRDLAWAHLALHAFVPDWAEVERLVFATELSVQGAPGLALPVWRAALDTGGYAEKEWNRTEEAYQWLRLQNARRPGRVFGIKGVDKMRRSQQKIRPTVVKTMPGSLRQQIPGGLLLYLLDSSQLRDEFFWRLTAHQTLLPCVGCKTETPADALAAKGGACPRCGAEVPGWADHPRRLSLYSECGPEFAAHVLGMEKRRDPKGLYAWHKVKQHDLLDASVYAHACADVQWMGGVRVLPDPAPGPAALAPSVPSPDPSPTPRRRRW